MGDKKTGDGKPRFDLMPWDNMAEVARAFEYGANEYAPHDYRKQTDPDVYFAATMRHLLAHKTGEKIDPDSGQPHLAHAVASILIMMGIPKWSVVGERAMSLPLDGDHPSVDIKHHAGCGCACCEAEAHREYLRKHPELLPGNRDRAPKNMKTWKL